MLPLILRRSGPRQGLVDGPVKPARAASRRFHWQSRSHEEILLGPPSESAACGENRAFKNGLRADQAPLSAIDLPHPHRVILPSSMVRCHCPPTSDLTRACRSMSHHDPDLPAPGTSRNSGDRWLCKRPSHDRQRLAVRPTIVSRRTATEPAARCPRFSPDDNHPRDAHRRVVLVAIPLRPRPGRDEAVGSVVLARSASANPSSFARYGPRTGPRIAHPSACESICFAIASLPTASLRLGRSSGRGSRR
jgi:hypothetical protein